MSDPRNVKIVSLDIELSPMEARIWDRRDQNIGLNQITKDWFLLAWSAKWFGTPVSSLIYRDQQYVKPMDDDRESLKAIWKILDEADTVITHNGKRFDARKLNARFILNGMKPPSAYKHYDTLQLAQRVGSFTSSSLEYLTHKLCTKYKKLSHRKYPGMALWNECLAGNADAWAEMKKYNIHDTLSDEELAMKLCAWAPNSFPFLYASPGLSKRCGRCGEYTLHKNGTRKTRSKEYTRYHCTSCGAWPKETLKGGN